MTLPRVRTSTALVLALAVSFLAGRVSAGVQFATSINKGLVNAFSSVGQNLFGDAAFDAVAVPPNPTLPAGSVQLYVADDVKLNTSLNVFTSSASPTDPCRTAMQIRSIPQPPPIKSFEIVVDPDVAPDAQIVFESLAAYKPSLERCVSPGGVDQ
jgi:hypothetical protein